MEIDFEKLPRFKTQAIKILSLIPQWAFAHNVPEEAVRNQIYTSHAWCDSNPKRAPKKDHVRFLWSWMAQAKRYGNLVDGKKQQIIIRAPDIEPEMTMEELVAIRKQNMGGIR